MEAQMCSKSSGMETMKNLIASKAKWDPQIEGLGRAGEALSALRAEVKYQCERQEVLKHLVVSKK